MSKSKRCEHHRRAGRYGNQGDACGLRPGGLGYECCSGDERNCRRPETLAEARRLTQHTQQTWPARERRRLEATE